MRSTAELFVDYVDAVAARLGDRVDTWITDPKVALPGTKMTFAGMKDPKDRTDTIAYLMVHTGYKP